MCYSYMMKRCLPRTFISLFLIIATTFALACPQTGAARDQWLGLNAVAGTPYLLGVQMSYIASAKFHFGFGFGSLPINSLLQAKIKFDPVPIDLPLDGVFNIYTSATYSITSSSVFTRYYPNEDWLFTELGYSFWKFNASVNGDLKNETLGTVSHAAISGNGTLNQHMLTLAAGYEHLYQSGFFFNIALGASWLVRVYHTVTIGGNASQIAPLVSGADEKFTAASESIKSQIDKSVQTYRDKISILPALFFSIGYVF